MCWKNIGGWGEPGHFAVVETGAGSGSLLEPLAASLSVSIRAAAVEVSAAARAALAERLPHVKVWSPSEVPARLTGVVIANEVADNLPMAAAARERDGWSEMLVGEEDGELILTAAPARREVGEWLEAYAGDVPPGGTAVAQLAARDWLAEWADRLAAGSLLIIDYGGTTEDLTGGDRAGTLRTHRAHRPGPHPLETPGQADITADVNFTALADAARARGLESELLTQRRFFDPPRPARLHRRLEAGGTGTGPHRGNPEKVANARSDHRGGGPVGPFRPGRLPSPGRPPPRPVRGAANERAESQAAARPGGAAVIRPFGGRLPLSAVRSEPLPGWRPAGRSSRFCCIPSGLGRRYPPKPTWTARRRFPLEPPPE